MNRLRSEAKSFVAGITTVLSLGCTPAWAWDQHAQSSDLAFEKVPDVSQAAPVRVEPLETFLKAESNAIEALLDEHESWAKHHLRDYAARPNSLRYSANSLRTDDQHRLAFFSALRISPLSRFALYVESDLRNATPPRQQRLKPDEVSTLPDVVPKEARLVALRVGDIVSPLAVLASATSEPDYGIDIDLWQDSPSPWGKNYGFGKQPFGNPHVSISSQAPFHMGFHHEHALIYSLAPSFGKTYISLRYQQYATLSALAFRTGHAYWGWRFAGLALHYLQDLTQPYHARLAPSLSAAEIVGINFLASIGLPDKKNQVVTLISNRHFALEKYQNESMLQACKSKAYTPLESSLHDTHVDAQYPTWRDDYLIHVIAAQSATQAFQIDQALSKSLPTLYVNDPNFEFATHASNIQFKNTTPPITAPQLDIAVSQLMRNFGAYSRIALQNIRQQAKQNSVEKK